MCSYSRQYKVVDFEDDYTRAALSKAKQKCVLSTARVRWSPNRRAATDTNVPPPPLPPPLCRTFGLITPRGVAASSYSSTATAGAPCCVGRVWAALESAGMKVASARMLTLSRADAASIASGLDSPITPPAGGDCKVIALEITGEDACSQWRALRDHLEDIGSISTGEVGVPVAPEHDERLRAAIFGPLEGRLPSASDVTGGFGGDCTCVIVLPSAVARGQAGQIIEDLLAAASAAPAPATAAVASGAAGARGASGVGASATAAAVGGAGTGRTTSFASDAAGGGGVAGSSGGGGGPLALAALGTYDFDRKCADEFLEVYKLVIPDYAVSQQRSARARCRAVSPPAGHASRVVVRRHHQHRRQS